MTIQFQSSKSDSARDLASQHPYMTPKDIPDLTGIPLSHVKFALSKRSKRQLKSVAR